MAQTEKERVTEVVVDFSKNILNEGSNDNMCFTAIYALSEHFKNNGIEYSLGRGFVNDKCPHYWLEYEDVIIDLTPNQIQFNNSEVFEVPLIRVKQPSDGLLPTVEINSLISPWAARLIGEETDDNISKPPLELIPDYLSILIKAAIVFINDNKSNEDYFVIVFKACNHYSIEKVISIFGGLPDWEKFYSRFQKWENSNNQK